MWVLKNPLQLNYHKKCGCHGDHTPTPTMHASQWHQCVHDPIPMTTKFTNGASASLPHDSGYVCTQLVTLSETAWNKNLCVDDVH